MLELLSDTLNANSLSITIIFPSNYTFFFQNLAYKQHFQSNYKCSAELSDAKGKEKL